MAIKGDILWSMLVATVFKNTPMGISWFLMLYVINFGHVLNMWDFGKQHFTTTIDWKQNYSETVTLTQREIKTVLQIGLLNLRWYQRNYSVFDKS